MKVLVAPDKFKGSLSAVAAAEAIARGFQRVLGDDPEIAPIADGGEGFAETLQVALRGEWKEVRAHDALGREIRARYVWIAHRQLAVLEMSEASGLWRVRAEERDPLHATTFGTGEIIRDAVAHGARCVLVGLGGSATTDGGIGMAEALGFEFLTSDGESLPAVPANLLALTRIDAENAIDLPEIIAACDVENPLLGPRGTAQVFARQKGADDKTVAHLELCMENLADVVQQEFGIDHREAAGAGAAGGLGFGLLSFCNARIRCGFDVVAEAMNLETRIRACDLVITGEGRLDAQTLEGKGPAGVAALARKYQKPVIAFAGSVTDDPRLHALFSATCTIIDEPVTLQDAMNRAAEFLERAATRAARLIKLGSGDE